MKRNRQQHGFTLIEVLVSMSLFAVGMLGIALYLAKGMQTTADNEAYALAMRIAQQAVEPLYVASNQSRADLQTALQTLNSWRSNDDFPFPFVYGTKLKRRFHVTIDDAKDRDNNDLLQTTTATKDWKPPFTVVLNVQYNDGNTTHDFKTAHVLVPPPGS